MSDKPTSDVKPASPAHRPAPPPYNPDKALIGYIEKGQSPPAGGRGDSPGLKPMAEIVELAIGDSPAARYVVEEMLEDGRVILRPQTELEEN